jgi:membrane-associated phospholipid phosphatase
MGYIAGASYKRVEKLATRMGLLLLVLIVLGLIVSRVLRHLRERSERLRALGDRVANLRFFAWVRRRFPRQVAWIRARLDPSSPQGFALTFTIAVGLMAAWLFGGLTQDVVGHDEAALFDPRVLRWVVAHRTAWLTAVMNTVTWLGSNAVIVPFLVIVGTFLIVRRRDWRPAATLAGTLVGAIVLYDIVKAAVHRPRPPASVWIGRYSGGSFPSGHATQTIAFYGMLALVLTTGRSNRAKAWGLSGAALVAILVGASRIYLGAHWLTDVLGGYALGATWLAVIVAFTLAISTRNASRAGMLEPEPA